MAIWSPSLGAYMHVPKVQVLAALAMVLACDRLDDSQTDQTSLAALEGVPVASVPPAPAGGGAEPGGTTSTPVVVTAPLNTTDPGKNPGFLLRTLKAPSVCATRQSDASAPVVLAPCADQTSQSWRYDRGLLSSDGVYCIGSTTAGLFSMLPCTAAKNLVRWNLLTVSGGFSIAPGQTQSNLYLAANDTMPGTAVKIDSVTQTNMTNWLLTRDSNSNSGSPFYFRGNLQSCLTVDGSVLSLAPCKFTKNQLWNVANGAVNSDNGGCLFCDSNTQQFFLSNNCTIGSPGLGTWMQFTAPVGLACLTRNANGLIPAPDASGTGLVLRTPLANDTAFWTYGGPALLPP